MLVKYPRTPHLPSSPGRSSDDKVLRSTDHFVGKIVVATEKMDGENSTVYPSGKTHARSLDSANHPSRDWLKAFWASRCYLLGEGMRVCGENMYAKHSIGYTDLPSYFLGFSVWDGYTCLPWDDTLMWFKELGVTPVRELYRGVYTKELEHLVVSEGSEGYVIRLVDGFGIRDFGTSVAKYVRPNHVQTDEHWMNQQVVKNILAEGEGGSHGVKG